MRSVIYFIKIYRFRRQLKDNVWDALKLSWKYAGEYDKI